MLNNNTARFWVWINGGWVRLALRPGQSLEWHCTEGTDEGWRSEWRGWHHAGESIESGFATRERDCDGLFDRSGESECALTALASRVDEYTDGLAVPEWEPVDSRQRDHAAEAMGY